MATLLATLLATISHCYRRLPNKRPAGMKNSIIVFRPILAAVALGAALLTLTMAGCKSAEHPTPDHPTPTPPPRNPGPHNGYGNADYKDMAPVKAGNPGPHSGG